jgi:hypothetical protein
MFTPTDGLPALQVVGRVLHEQATLYYAAEAQVCVPWQLVWGCAVWSGPRGLLIDLWEWMPLKLFPGYD